MRNAALWTAAVVLFVGGDLVTTAVGLQAGAVEANPVARTMLAGHGLAVILAAKAAVLVVAGAGQRRAEVAPWAFPLALAVMGAVITLWNARIIALTAG